MVGGLAAAGMAVLAAGLVSADAQAPSAPYVPKQSDRPAPVEGDEAGLRADLRRPDAEGLGGRPDLLARRGWRAGRRDHAGDRRQEQHLHHLARRPAEGLRAEARLPHHRGRQQRHQLPQRQRARSGDAGQHSSRCAATSSTSTGRKRYVGNNYEEKGRLFMAMRGQVTRVIGGRPPVVLATIGDDAELAHAGHRRLECGAPDRPRQHADALPQRPAA